MAEPRGGHMARIDSILARTARRARHAIAPALIAASANVAHAQSAPSGVVAYPAKPVRLVVGNAPGGSDDFHGRLIAQKLSDVFGQQFLVDNRGGSGGMVARSIVARSPADGYTLLLGAVSMAASQHLYLKPQADAVRDFAPVSQVAVTHGVLVVHPSVPAKTAGEFIALARARPGQLNFGSTGVGGGPHLAAALFCSMAKITATHVPYKGAGAGIYVDLLSGQLDFYIGPISTALRYIAPGKVRPLAVTGVTRSPKLPAVPTMAQAALPGYEMSGWYGVFAPAGTAREIIGVLNAALVKQLATPALREALLSASSEPRAGTPQEMAQRLAEDIERYGRIIKLAGIKPQ
jgi:tripartite-type tricarboxylate transporter receptor subunit TctC